MKLKSYLARQIFNPSLIGIFVNPFFFARKNLYKHIRQHAGHIRGKVLDVGCGKKPYQYLFTDVREYIGMDIENSGHDHSHESIDVFYDGKTFPFPEQSFDSVLTNQVFEHVFDPQNFMKEISRVLKPNGHLLLTVPFSWDEHEQPYDFARYSSFGIVHILKDHGFTVVHISKSTTGFIAIAQLFMGYVYKTFYSENRYLNLLGTMLFISPIAIAAAALSIFAPSSEDFYLDNVVVAVKN